MALISDLPNATPQKSDLMEIQNGQTSSNNSSVGQLMQLSASENLAPAYDANAGVYVVGDFVSYNGTLYQCNTAIATPEAFDATKWTAVKVTEISSGASVVQLTQAEYTALSTAEKMNGSIYKLTDKALMLCLDEEYHPVKELTTAQYEALSTAEQNNGTIYIKTDAETTGEDIPVNTLTPDTSINSAINACFGRTGEDIPVSSSDNTSIANAIGNLAILASDWNINYLSPSSFCTLLGVAYCLINNKLKLAYVHGVFAISTNMVQNNPLVTDLGCTPRENMNNIGCFTNNSTKAINIRTSRELTVNMNVNNNDRIEVNLLFPIV